MIKITRDNATLPISENRNLIKHLNDADIEYHIKEEYISISVINGAIEKLFNNQYLKDMSKTILMVMPEKLHRDLLSDLATLRMYDSSVRTVDNGELFKLDNGIKLYATVGKISEVFILALSDLNIVPEKTTITIDDIVIESNKDLSKVDINVVGSVKLVNIKVA